ncbi:hypothetical protein JCM8547_006758 [Rhodosporidiobolus lusitaniae]
MSLFCSISGVQPLHPVVSKASGQVFERDLIVKALRDNEGKDPITGDTLSEDDLLEIKTAPSAPTAPPRAPTFTSVPSLLHTLQQEWDATMLECLELRRQGAELRQELSHALYKEDAAMRVLARVTRERDEAREALASVKATLGPAFSTGNGAADSNGDASMEGVEQQEAAALPAAAKQRVEETAAALSAGRKKRKPSPESATPEVVKTFTQTSTVPSLHTTKPPGVSALDLAKDGEVLVTGGLDKDVIVFSRSTNKNIAKLKGHAKKVTSVVSSTTLTSDNVPSFLVSASVDKTIRVWTPNGSKQVYGNAATLPLQGEVTGLALHPSNTLVAASSTDGTWAIVDVADADKAAVILTGSLPDGASSALTSVAFHPDGGLFAVGTADSSIYIFDILSAKCAGTLSSPSPSDSPSPVVSLSFSENGYILASASSGSPQVYIWDLRKLAVSHTIVLSEDAASVSAVAFDYSNQFLAVVGSDARVYQFKTWELLVRSDENQAELTAVKWGKDAREVVVVGLDRTARVLAALEA